jgi:hypothetical protein
MNLLAPKQPFEALENKQKEDLLVYQCQPDRVVLHYHVFLSPQTLLVSKNIECMYSKLGVGYVCFVTIPVLCVSPCTVAVLARRTFHSA